MWPAWAPGPRIALWGAFDVEDCGPAATRRVLEAELVRRLPGATVTAFAPLGRLRPLGLDAGRPAEPLPDATPEALAGLRDGFDCILVCGEDSLSDGARAAALWGGSERVRAAVGLLVDGLGAEFESACPVLWAGVSVGSDPDAERAARLAAAGLRRGPVTVLDEASRRRLGGAGVTGEICLLPHLGLLLPRLLEPDLLQRRGEFARLMEWGWASETRVVAVRGDHRLQGCVEDIAAGLLPLVTAGEVEVELSPAGSTAGEEAFASALESSLGGRCRRLPGVALPEDQVAALSRCAAYIGPPGFALSAARALRLPGLVPEAAAADAGGIVADLGAEVVAPTGLAEALRKLPRSEGCTGVDEPAAAIERLEGFLDGLAGRAVLATLGRREGVGAPEGAAIDALTDMVRRAHEERGLRLVAQRAALQAAADARVAELQARLDAAGAEIERVGAELHAARAANDRMVSSRTWRYTQPVRDVRARLRDRGR